MVGRSRARASGLGPTGRAIAVSRAKVSGRIALHDQPLVSIIVPSFNQGRFIGETIASALAQDYRPLEVLVLDGGSTDETMSLLADLAGAPELVVQSEPDEGVVDAVNKGLRKASGQILAIQSSDDVYLPGAIAAAVAALHDHPEVGMVFGDVEHIDENSRVIGRDILPTFSLAHYLGRLTYVPQPSAFFRAAMARSVGGWRNEVSYAADADYWIRIALRYPVVKIDRTMARYRYHPGQRDKHVHRILRDWERMIAELPGDSLMSPELARFARMGVHLARYRYTPEANWSARTRHLYAAAFANPGAITHPAFPKRELLPGRAPIWAALSRIKRVLGLRPRGQ
jgi:glycosyltransferase involved in cell wall biosynthesis